MAVPLSVIVPVVDEAPIVGAALQALESLRRHGAEIIVVDGQSADDSAALARAHADVVLVVPRGRAAQMNAGAARARGEVLLFLHVDTRLPGDAAEAIEAGLRGVAAGSAGGRVWGRFDVEIAGRAPRLKTIAAWMNRRSRWTGIATGDQAIFVTQAAFGAVGGYPEQPLMEDIELCRRLRRLGPPACLRQRVVTSGRRWESRGVWRTIFLMWRLRLLYALGMSAERVARSYR